MDAVAASQIKVVCQTMLAVLNSDVQMEDGTLLRAGDQALILPQTTADCVLMSSGRTLAEAWRSEYLELEDICANLVKELSKLCNRVSRIEVGMVDHGEKIASAQTKADETASALVEKADKAYVDAELAKKLDAAPSATLS